jgi:hypothetical protein
MTEDVGISSEEREADRMRYGEYRRVPIARSGPFRVDRAWFRHATNGEHELLPELVFEIDASSEFDLLGALFPLYRAGMRPRTEGFILSSTEIARLATDWYDKYRHSTRTSLARYRRRTGPATGGTEMSPGEWLAIEGWFATTPVNTEEAEMTPGEWLIMPIFRPADRPSISMVEAIPLVEAALASMER